MAQMLGEHLHHAPIGSQMIVNRYDFFHPGTSLYIKEIPKTIRIGLVRAEETEITLPGIFRKHISHQLAELTSRFVLLGCSPGDPNRIVGKPRNIQVDQQCSSVRVRICSHTMVTCGCKRSKLWQQATILVEHVLRLITVHPLFQKLQMLRVRLHFRDRNLVCAKCALNRDTIDFLWPRPSFGRTQDDRRPAWLLRGAMSTGIYLIAAYFLIADV